MPNNKTVLCLGNNTEDTDIRTKNIARNVSAIYHGLLTTTPLEILAGYYQTSFYDIDYAELLLICESMDEIIFLDQEKQSYPDEYGYFKTISLLKLISNQQKVTFLNNEDLYHTIEDEIKVNKSLCILPFIQSTVIQGENYPCCRSTTPLSKYNSTIAFASDSSRNTLKEKMIKGEQVPEFCQLCYQQESHKIISARISETIEWANRLNLKSIADLISITDAVYYEVRASNKCNLLCRSCTPQWSSLIANEDKKIKKIELVEVNHTGFDRVNLENIERLYIAGGEPSITPEVHDFLEKCIAAGKVDFEIIINTNAAVFTQQFKSLILNFTNLTFEISVDGFEEVNHYVRWPTKWTKLIDNIDFLYQSNFRFSFNTVVSIYTISRLYKLLTFLTTKYPNSTYHLTSALPSGDILSPLNFVDAEIVIDNLTKIKELSVYKNSTSVSSVINEYYDYFSNRQSIDLDKLQAFFAYNDLLDQSRDVKLIDYIPELEQCRKLITKPI